MGVTELLSISKRNPVEKDETTASVSKYAVRFPLKTVDDVKSLEQQMRKEKSLAGTIVLTHFHIFDRQNFLLIF